MRLAGRNSIAERSLYSIKQNSIGTSPTYRYELIFDIDKTVSD